jgi:hypothetical protein
MAVCKDPSLTYLNGAGYNVVRLPRAGIEPMDILGRDQSIERLGSLDQMWSSSRESPAAKGPLEAAGVSGQKTSELKLSIGLKLLSSTLGALGAARPEVSAAYSRATKISFTFTDVKAFVCDPLQVGEYLVDGDLATSNPVVRRYFDDEDTAAFIITEVLKSSAITVTASNDQGTAVTVDVPAIQQTVGAKVSVNAAANSSGAVTYAGAELLTFGFKCFGIAYVNGQWQMYSAKPSAALAFDVPGALRGGAASPMLLGDGRLIVR